MRSMTLLVLGVVAPALAGQEPAPAPVTLKLHPAAAPTPAMKYHLLPPVRDLQPGNAAVFYQRAHSPDWYRSLERLPALAKVNDWLDGPAGKMPDKEIRQLLAFTGIFKELDHAARCENCDWQMSTRLRDEGVALLLADVQSFRQMSQLLALKVRVEALDGHAAESIRTLQTGFAFSRHVGDCPIVINALVAMAMGHVVLGGVEEFIQRPGAPNLYWALRDLPEPLIDLRRPLQGDRLAVDAWWPEVRKALGQQKFQPVPLATLRSSLDKAVAQTRYEDRMSAATLVALAHPQAMAYFRKLGHTQEELDALPVTQVVLMHSLAQWDRWYDAVYRWHNVPYWQARAGLKKASEEREQVLRNNRETASLLQHMLPAAEPVFFQKARLQRRIAALQCIEAIRMYAATHDGALPDNLSDIRAVPVPIDPVTGNAFVYTNDDGVARLYGPAPPAGTGVERSTLAYQFTIVPKK